MGENKGKCPGLLNIPSSIDHLGLCALRWGAWGRLAGRAAFLEDAQTPANLSGVSSGQYPLAIFQTLRTSLILLSPPDPGGGGNADHGRLAF